MLTFDDKILDNRRKRSTAKFKEMFRKQDSFGNLLVVPG